MTLGLSERGQFEHSVQAFLLPLWSLGNDKENNPSRMYQILNYYLCPKSKGLEQTEFLGM